jgi:hypothetical protein
MTLGVALVCAGAVPAVAATTNESVHVLTVNTWFGGNEGPGGSVGSATLLPGPGTPPAGMGSAQLMVDSNGRASLGTNEFAGTRLDAITGLTYSAYTTSPSVSVVPVLQFDVDYDSTDANTAYQGRLTFLPSALTANTWTGLDALAGQWYASQAPGSAVCSQGTPCTWAQVLANFPDAAIRNDSVARGALLLRLGGPIPGGATSYVDNLSFSTAANTTNVDFEPGATVTPSVGLAGTPVTVTAYGFKAKRAVSVFYFTLVTAHSHKAVCRSKADVNGVVTCTFNVPTTGPAGVHSIQISGRTNTKPSHTLKYKLDFVRTP